MNQITQAMRSFFTLAGSVKGRRSTRIEFWVGFALLVFGASVRTSIILIGGASQAETPIWLLGIGAAITVLFVVPFVSLCVRRLQDAGLSGWLFAVIIILLLVFSPLALVVLIALGSLPSHTKASHLESSDTNPSRELADNPIIGLRFGRLMKMLALVIGLPIVLFFLLGLASMILEY
jgi:uncharacterized membrane protein YhaH (DUF805 family)